MLLLGLHKLPNVETFTTRFLNYDLLAQRWLRYGYVYPFVEMGEGLLVMAGVLKWLSAPAALIVASIGTVSVFKAVYIDECEFKCACVGGDSNVRVIGGKPDDDWYGDWDALEAVMTKRLTLHLLEGVEIIKTNKNQDLQ